jgi:hypothetical protein
MQQRAAIGSQRSWLSKRRWLSKETEATYSTLGVELLCSWAWPMSYIVYATNTSTGSAWITGWLLYFATCTGLVWINARAMAIASRDPAVSGAYVVADLLFENDDRPRFVVKESRFMLLGRLAAQWIGALVGNGFIELHFPLVKTSMGRIWTPAPPQSFYTMLALQCFIGSLIGGFALRLSQTDPKKHLTQGVLWDAVRSGSWASLFLYPWGGPAFSVISSIWMVRAFHLPSGLAIGIHLALTVVQGIGAKLVSELSFRESAQIK